MVMTLAVVIGVMIGGMYLLKKYVYKTPATTSGDMIRVISSHYLGPKKSIVLVEVLGQVVLLGVTDHHMTMLTTITEPEAAEKIRSLHAKENFPTMPDPLSRCKSLLKSIGNR